MSYITSVYLYVDKMQPFSTSHLPCLLWQKEYSDCLVFFLNFSKNYVVPKHKHGDTYLTL